MVFDNIDSVICYTKFCLLKLIYLFIEFSSSFCIEVFPCFPTSIFLFIVYDMAVFFKTITFRFINRMFGVNSTLVVAVALSCPIVYHPMDHSTPGFPFLHHLLEFAQTLVHWVSNAIQASQPVTPLSSCPQSFWASDFFFFFSNIRSSHKVAKILECQPQHQSFQWIFRADLL